MPRSGLLDKESNRNLKILKSHVNDRLKASSALNIVQL